MWAPQAIASGIGHTFSGKYFSRTAIIICLVAIRFLSAMDQTFLQTSRFDSSSSEAHLR
jgi:hypothetical protein